MLLVGALRGKGVCRPRGAVIPMRVTECRDAKFDPGRCAVAGPLCTDGVGGDRVRPSNR